MRNDICTVNLHLLRNYSDFLADESRDIRVLYTREKNRHNKMDQQDFVIQGEKLSGGEVRCDNEESGPYPIYRLRDEKSALKGRVQ